MAAIYIFRDDFSVGENENFIHMVKNYDKILPLIVWDTEWLEVSGTRACVFRDAIQDFYGKFTYHGVALHVIFGKISDVLITILPKIHKQYDKISIHLSENFTVEFRNKLRTAFAKLSELYNYVNVQFGKTRIFSDKITKFTVEKPRKNDEFEIFEMLRLKKIDEKFNEKLEQIFKTSYIKTKKQFEKLAEYCPHQRTFGRILRDKLESFDVFERFESDNVSENSVDSDDSRRSYVEGTCFYVQPMRLASFLNTGMITVGAILFKLKCDDKLHREALEKLREQLTRHEYNIALYNYLAGQTTFIPIQKDAYTRYEITAKTLEDKETARFVDLWKNGKTGFPIVDAGIREMQRTGSMHTAVKSVVASFFVFDIGAHWRYADEFFAQHLGDYDKKQSVVNWFDILHVLFEPAHAAMIKNPQKQAEKIDPNEEYIRENIVFFRKKRYGTALRWTKLHVNYDKNALIGYCRPMFNHQKRVKQYIEINEI